ncbi:MAG: SusC/RagA family TonB-linked outer membrane protein [Dysgonamonadaceae bacterium]|jgi:TonB-linked SusC/RagA family outer membrane protein|nr:SusC/RagA family TonB-linked outer membrane protein [Dysgonamonadaceae bacterium]
MRKDAIEILLKFLCVLVFAFTPLVAIAQQAIKGVVTDAETKGPLPGVTIKTAKSAATSDGNGQFTITAAEGDVITFLFIGFKTQEYKVTGKEDLLKITLQEDVKLMQEVVIEAGIVKRDKMGFTGSYTAISKEELKSIGNTNLIQSLKSLDPAFVIVENGLSGSNPNVMANIEIRGQTTMNISSVQDEASATQTGNLPLFILDGFEATLQEINDLNINRVESITILKDAGSTAIYGSKGANGVVVIETLRPASGKFFVSYSGDFQLAAPDLSVYNMMNAAEKLEFERLAGRYSYMYGDGYDVSIPTIDDWYTNQSSYYERLAWVQSGVDSYWLNEPVRLAFTQAHSLTLSGGEKNLLFNVGFNYKNNPGVMKGSARDTYGGNIKLVYRGVEGLSIQNNISLSGTNAAEGPWGSFSDFVNANPYYRKREADGTIPKYLDIFENFLNTDNTQIIAVNPLYNATLNTRHDKNIFNLTNNTSLDWTINSSLLLRASLSLKRNTENKIDFVDPRHSSFDNDTYDKKGTYKSAYTSYWSYKANASVNYLKSIGQNNITAIGRYNIEETNETAEAFKAIGFPEGAVGYPSYAFSYDPGKRPDYSTSKTRILGLIGIFNYNYNFRYLFDVTYNMDGSTNFGRNKRFQSFWSAGMGWNIHREAFAKDWAWLTELKLRGSYGTNGNQNINVTTSSIYSYYVGSNIFGQSSYLSQVGNPDLRWQVVEKLSAGLDAGLLDNNLKITLDAYRHLTDPQIVVLGQRPSTGVSYYPLNLGYLKTEGYEFKVFYNIINRPKDELLLSVRATGGHTKGTYGGFANSLEQLNEAYKQEDNSELLLQSLQHYFDGNSPEDIWAVRSLGIDPATGLEIFQTKDGKPTTVYNPDDRVVVANSRPDIEGIVGFTIRYKKLMLNTNLRYSMGAHTFNTALFRKVENISRESMVYNQDKRALYDRWKETGDISEFKSIEMVTRPTERTPVSSRFVQKNNYLRGESAKLTWNFTGEKWLKSVRLQDLSLSLSMEDFFNLTSIQVERSTDYPFQRSVIMNLSALF